VKHLKTQFKLELILPFKTIDRNVENTNSVSPFILVLNMHMYYLGKYD